MMPLTSILPVSVQSPLLLFPQRPYSHNGQSHTRTGPTSLPARPTLLFQAAAAALMLRLPILNALLIYVYILSLSIKNQPLTGCERLICFIRYTVFSSTNRNSCSSLIRVIDSSFRRSLEAFTHASAANLINYES